jgi:hypothetical protein
VGLDVLRPHSGALEQDRVGGSQRELISLAAPADGAARVRARFPLPGAGNFITDLVATGANGRTQGDVDIGDARTERRGHDRQRFRDDPGNGPSPAGVGHGYYWTAARTGGVDEDHRLAVRVHCQEDRAWLAGNEGVAPADQRRPRSRSPSRMPCLRHVHLRAVHLMEGHEMIGMESRGVAPALAHRPSVGAVARRAVADVAIGESHAWDAAGDAVVNARERS